jgi:hypothetical protein
MRARTALSVMGLTIGLAGCPAFLSDFQIVDDAGPVRDAATILDVDASDRLLLGDGTANNDGRGFTAEGGDASDAEAMDSVADANTGLDDSAVEAGQAPQYCCQFCELEDPALGGCEEYGRPSCADDAVDCGSNPQPGETCSYSNFTSEHVVICCANNLASACP